MIQTLIDRTTGGAAAVLSPELQRRYGGDLRFPSGLADRPYVIGNFVSTLDGIVSFAIPGKAGGGEISGHNEADRFIMGLLRASADAVMIGAGTLHATDPRHLFVPECIFPEAAALYASYRKDILGKPERPYNVIVSGSGRIDLDRRIFRNSEVPVVIATTGKGAERLRADSAAGLSGIDVLALDGPGGTIAPAAILDALRARYGVRLVLHEGGPTLYGDFLGAGLVDELFVTLSPQLAGSGSEHPRPTMVWGTEFRPDTAPWFEIASVRRSGDHLYLRYRRHTVSVPHVLG